MQDMRAQAGSWASRSDPPLTRISRWRGDPLLAAPLHAHAHAHATPPSAAWAANLGPVRDRRRGGRFRRSAAPPRGLETPSIAGSKIPAHSASKYVGIERDVYLARRDAKNPHWTAAAWGRRARETGSIRAMVRVSCGLNAHASTHAAGCSQARELGIALTLSCCSWLPAVPTVVSLSASTSSFAEKVTSSITCIDEAQEESERGVFQ